MPGWSTPSGPRHASIRARRLSNVVRAASIAALLLLVAGCGGRQTIEGTVTLDDQPLEQGYITFRPMKNVAGAPIGGPIENGKFAIQPKEPLAGDFRVEITSLGKTGKKARDDKGKSIDVEGQVLPARYNSESTLQAQLKPRQRNEFPFPLTTQRK
jgi:hypothetical protein